MLPKNCFFFSKNDVAALQKSLLFGYGITDDSLIFGTDGLSQYLAANGADFPEEGRFCGFFIDTGKVIIRADRTGQECLYLYSNGDDWAVSNSFLLLATQVAKRTGLTFYPPAAHSFHLKNGVHIGEQIVSHQTMVREIKLVPLTSELIVDRNTLHISEQTSSYIDRFTLSANESYEDTVVDVLQRGAGLVAALVEAGYPLNLFLSGGYDSRLVLGMALLSPIAREQLRVFSHEFKADDYRVAKSLCYRFSLELNGPPPQKAPLLSASDAIRMYLLSCGGTYLPFFPSSSYRLEPSVNVRLTGDQPTALTYFAGRGVFGGSPEKIAKDIELHLEPRGSGHQVRSDFLSTFDLIGMDRDHPAAMLAYYSAIRSRHHCGRNWTKSLGVEFLFTPLMQSSFVKLDLHNADRGISPKQFFADCFSALGNWATEEPFETKDRAFEPSILDASPFRGGLNLTPRRFRVFGRIPDRESFVDPDLYSIDLKTDGSPDAIKQQLQVPFYRAQRAKQSGIFTKEDYATANNEIKTAAGLPQGYRKTCHIIMTDSVLNTTSKLWQA